MSAANTLESYEIERLRAENYNAQVLSIARPHDDLMIIQVVPDRGIPDFHAGQYSVLGLGHWEPRISGTQSESPDCRDQQSIIKRAYSISCTMLDQQGHLQRVKNSPYYEFYIALVRSAEDHPPALTPRLFALREGDRIYSGPHVHGNYTLKQVQRDNDVIFAATGVGEAPHNAMIVELLSSGHRGRIFCVSCFRWKRDIAYNEKHRELEKRYSNYRYVTLTTREPENLQSDMEGYVGKRYLQDYFQSGDFEKDAKIQLSPQNMQVFLCGSPDMIGVPRHTHNSVKRYPDSLGMVEVLEQKGFHIDTPHNPGNIHFEKYW